MVYWFDEGKRRNVTGNLKNCYGAGDRTEEQRNTGQVNYEVVSSVHLPLLNRFCLQAGDTVAPYSFYSDFISYTPSLFFGSLFLL